VHRFLEARFEEPSNSTFRNRPNSARLSDILFSFHFGFFRCTEDHR